MKPERIAPGPGQESVWDYPRPPSVEASSKHIQVICNGVVIADSTRAKRVLETSSPPVFYLPPADVQMRYLTPTHHHSLCEWKGQASYYTVTVNDKVVANAAWYYPTPNQEYAMLRDYIAFYPGKMDACTVVDGEQVRAQPGDFYGGWITAEIVGPFKGDPGTQQW